MTAAGSGPHTAGRAPATSPPARPYIIAPAAAGSASRLAGRAGQRDRAEAGDQQRRRGQLGGQRDRAAAAPPHGAAAGTGRWARPASTMPNVASTDSWKPTWWTSSGSTASSAVTARQSTCRLETGRPSGERPAPPMPAIATARSTEGSKRVASAKKPSTPSVAAKRGHSRSRRSSGASTASRKATFWPETASRWVSPAPLEGGGQLRPLVPVVAQDEAREERALLGGERSGAGHEQAPQAVGQARHGSAPPPSRRTSRSRRPTTWRAASAPRPSRGSGPERPGSPQPLPGQPGAQRRAGAAPRPRLHPAAVDLDHGLHGPESARDR